MIVVRAATMVVVGVDAAVLVNELVRLLVGVVV